MNWEIFRAYDVRGVYPDDLDEEAYQRIAKAYTYLFHPKVMVIGRDARESSPALSDALTSGFLDAGVDVVDIGGITTDMLYYAVGASDEYSGGIVVSASHNPKQYNGAKMVREKAAAISSETGLFDIRDALKAEKDKDVSSATKGKVEKKDVLDDYLKHVLSFIDTDAINQFTFIGNANFGYVGRGVALLAEKLKLNLIPLNFEPDGTFPKGTPDPMLADNRAESAKLVKEAGADFAAIWDADADRCMFLDENGEFISGAYVTALLADILLTKHGSNNKIIFDPRVIWPAMKVCEQRGAQAIISKGGHAFIKDRMRKENALFAGEMSAHYYFRDNFYADNGVIPFLLILEHLSKTGKAFSEVMRPYMEGHYMSGELNYRVKDINKVIADVKARFSSEGKQDFTDGYSLDTDDWRFNIRPSNTEPLLRLNLEAHKPGLIEKIRAEIEEIIGSKPH
ncbi:MAG TPA: phosphomannomutase/phosphoglucomutase [Pyrinomonadaceae bacterium]|nr:phosphomannomutase/phosphoglucomutase [Pyrinomonadaceae bacterium]